MKDYKLARKEMESEIRRQRDLHQKEIRDHVAGLKYKTHKTGDAQDYLRTSAVELIEK